jgi:hypothetical protein
MKSSLPQGLTNNPEGFPSPRGVTCSFPPGTCTAALTCGRTLTSLILLSASREFSTPLSVTGWLQPQTSRDQLAPTRYRLCSYREVSFVRPHGPLYVRARLRGCGCRLVGLQSVWFYLSSAAALQCSLATVLKSVVAHPLVQQLA